MPYNNNYDNAEKNKKPRSISRLNFRASSLSPPAKGKAHRSDIELPPLKRWFLAAQEGDIHTTRDFLSQNAIQIGATDKFGNTALHLAARHGQLNIARFMLKHNQHQLHSQNKKGQTPLHIAASYHDVNMMKLFLSYDPEILEDNNGHTALDFAVISGGEKDQEIVRALLQSGQIDSTTYHQAFALAENEMRILLRDTQHKLAIIQSKKENGQQLQNQLYVIARVGNNLDELRLFLEQHPEVDINKPDSNGDTVLHIVLKNGIFPEIIECLLEKGANTHILNKEGKNALALAEEIAQEHSPYFDAELQSITLLLAIPAAPSEKKLSDTQDKKTENAPQQKSPPGIVSFFPSLQMAERFEQNTQAMNANLLPAAVESTAETSSRSRSGSSGSH
jgi:ankyrin repeat protein